MFEYNVKNREGVQENKRGWRDGMPGKGLSMSKGLA